ncbi:hypothetical protein [Gordonia sp. (in: high G+C Gram-positive bacteria)]|nr:hypothetical protein [Gordonia sp. (in: high G+C Gram-positive bacteria)]
MASRDRSTTILLAIVATLLAIAVAVVVTIVVLHRGTGDAAPPAGATATVIETAPAPPPVSTTTETAYVPPPVPTGSTVVEGGPCLESEARSFGTAADGESLVCNYMGADGGYVWVGHAENSGEVHDIGEPCDISVDRVAQDPSGKAIMCGGETWVGGP